MRVPPCLLAVAWLTAAGTAQAVDSVWNYAVEVTATVQTSPPQITLTWPQDTNGTPASYTIYRKAPLGTSWGNAIATLSGGTTTYTDSNVSVGTAYEYQIVKDFTQTAGYNGYGYIESGIQVPLVDNRGTAILIVDNTFSSSLAGPLQQLQQDLVGDGWNVIRHDVGRSDSVVSVKHLILADYNANPSVPTALFLFGHVPVPYSGLINPDGHPDHLGAWPADVYYGDMTGQWTDTTVNYVQTQNTDPADAARMTNVPGDGKFDQSTVPGLVALEVGRVDLANMPGDLQYDADPSFPSEQALLQQYLAKDHNFRFALVVPKSRALIGDYIGDKEQIAPAAAAFRSFAPIVGPSNFTNLNIIYNDAQGYWLPTLQSNDYLLALGIGAGSYSTISGIGVDQPYSTASTTDIVSADIRAMFVMVFGSWCGDWDNQDNIFRSILATPTYGLEAVYTGVPHWFVHPLGLGETMGYCARLTQNNTNPGLYETQVNLAANEIHIALMGDPTLHLDIVPPPSGLNGAAGTGAQLALNWTASPDSAVIGYHVYRASSSTGPFTRITSSPVAGTTFTDTASFGGATYMVRAVKLETTPSGSYYDASQGIFYTAGGSGAPAVAGGGGRLSNLSVLAQAGPGQTLDVGFVIGENGSSGAMPVLVRASGPALSAFGLKGVLANPVLAVFQGGAQVATNDNWGSNAAAVTAADSAVGAFALTDPASLDAALTATYSSGGYTAQVTSGDGGTGTALAEVYDATPPANESSATPRLINVSVIAPVGGAAGPLTLGFTVAGPGSEEVLVRGVGPSLAGFGVSGPVAAPQLTLLSTSGTVIASNAGWANNAALSAAFAQVGAFALQPGSADAALIATVPPGQYSAVITGQNGTVGMALGEVYEISQ